MSDTVPDCDTAVTVGRITLECPSCYNGFGFATLWPIKSRLRSAWKFSNVWKYMSSTQMSQITKFKSPTNVRLGCLPEKTHAFVWRRKGQISGQSGLVRGKSTDGACLPGIISPLQHYYSSILHCCYHELMRKGWRSLRFHPKECFRNICSSTQFLPQNSDFLAILLIWGVQWLENSDSKTQN